MRYKGLLLHFAFWFLGFTLSAQNHPNIILFIAGDVGWDNSGYYGNPDVKTPNIGKLASNGIRFNNFLLTASSCCPSRNNIITGRYPYNTGACELHTEPPLEMVSFPEILRQNGYYTAQSGKFHLGKYAIRGFGGTSQGKKIGDGGEELWLETLQNLTKEKPFFMWFAALDAHRPWGSNPLSGTTDSLKVSVPAYLANKQNTKTDLAHCCDEVARFENFIGLIVDELKRQGELENTLIYIMADNGRPFPLSKTRVNDRGMKTPFAAFRPEGTGSHSFSDLIDLKTENKSSDKQAEIFIAPRQAEELFNNANNPDQFNNLTFQKKHAKMQTLLKQVLPEWMDETGDNFPEKLTAVWDKKEPGYIKPKITGFGANSTV